MKLIKMMIKMDSRDCLQISLLILLGIILNAQSVFTGPISEHTFLKWLDELTGETKPTASNFLDWINIDVAKYSKTPSFDRRIPKKLKEISRINSGNCNDRLANWLRYDGALDSRNYDAQYVHFYSKLQYNLCLQDMELQRANAAANNMDKSKWVAWYDAIVSNRSSNGADLQIAAEKLARYLKRFVPHIESKNFATGKQHVEMVTNETKKIIKEVCPYVTRDIYLSNKYNKQAIEYLDKNRDQFDADPVTQLWSKSVVICSDQEEQAKLINLIIKIFDSTLDGVEIEDKDVSQISDPKIIKDFLLPPNDSIKQGSNSVRIGTPIDLLQKLDKIASDANDKQLVGKLLGLARITDESWACESRYIEKRQSLEKTYANSKYPNLESYVKSMNALQFHVCDMKMRFKAANLAVNLPSVQLARLEEFRHMFFYKNLAKLDRWGLFLEPQSGYGVCAVDYINRYYALKGEWKSKTKYAKNITKIIDMFDVGNYSQHLSESGKTIQKLVEQVNTWHKETMQNACDKLSDYLSKSDVDQYRELYQVQPGNKLGSTESGFFDYVLLCDHHKFFDSNIEILRALGADKNVSI